MPQTSYPGVYIEEFAPAPPIQPASTNVAAFVGFATQGPTNIPLRITSFARFTSIFGRLPVNGFYLWYAVRGFFENGGTDCFVVRATNGKHATWAVNNVNNRPLYTLATRTPRTGDDIDVAVANSSLLDGNTLRVFKPSATPTAPVGGQPAPDFTIAKELKLDGFHLFQPGDVVQAAGGRTRATVLTVNSTRQSLTLDTALPELAGATPTVVLAPVQPDDSVIRFEYVDAANTDVELPPQALVPGTLLKLDTGAVPPAPGSTAFGYVAATKTEYLNVPQGAAAAKLTYRVEFRDAPGLPIDRSVAGTHLVATSLEFDLKITSGGVEKLYKSVSLDPSHVRYVVSYVNDRDSSILITAVDPQPIEDPDKLIPDNGHVTQTLGAKENPQTFPTSPDPLTGGLDTLRKVPEVSLVSIPDAVALKTPDLKNSVLQSVIAHCEVMADRFGVLDAHSSSQEPFAGPSSSDPSIEQQRASVVSMRGYAGLYYPWIKVTAAGSGQFLAVPPGGHICGLMARVDGGRGVHKAPANETLNGAVTITQDMTDTEQGPLNMKGINVIRTFTAGGRPVVYGARTTASDLNWQYINVRRLFLFLERSISKSLQSTIFEPNNTDLWGRLNRVITAFLMDQWRAGALFGTKASEAFYVKIDEALNPFEDRQLGKLTIEIGVNPTYPAEFIVVRIGIWNGGKTISES